VNGIRSRRQALKGVARRHQHAEDVVFVDCARPSHNREVLGDPLDVQAAQVGTCVLLIEVRVNFSGKFLDAAKVVRLRRVRRVPPRNAAQPVHSFRVWLACALLAAGATPEQIMLMVRWSSEAARKLYARLAMTTQCSLHTGALHASFDSIRAHTLLDAASATGASSDVNAAAEALRIAVGLLDTVTDASRARVASAAEHQRMLASTR
jgi:hypothetical protein